MTVVSARPRVMRYLSIAVALVIAQTAVLGWMIESRASLLRSGEEVVLKTAPVDPRDLLRGDYVILSYDISTIPAAVIGDQPSEAGWQVMYVRLKPGADGFWTVAQAAFAPLAPEPGSVVLETQRFYFYGGTDLKNNPETTLRLDYGIERFYVPEGEGREIETARNEGAVTVLARVGSNGQAQIRALRMDGEALYEEPLY